jgi:hypothetical protein
MMQLLDEMVMINDTQYQLQQHLTMRLLFDNALNGAHAQGGVGGAQGWLGARRG